jgi:hypothetical protein
MLGEAMVKERLTVLKLSTRPAYEAADRPQ